MYQKLLTLYCWGSLECRSCGPLNAAGHLFDNSYKVSGTPRG